MIMKRFKHILRTIWNYLKVWRELSSIAIALFVWANSTWFLRRVDPTAATYDAGVFQVYLFAIIGLFLLHGIVRILMKLIWTSSDHYLDSQFAHDFKTIGHGKS